MCGNEYGDVKIKLSHYCLAGAKGERKYSSLSFLTFAQNGVSGQRHAPAALYPGKEHPRPIV
jgi:hypothetical protein